jgi:RHS repeat-associated protein
VTGDPPSRHLCAGHGAASWDGTLSAFGWTRTGGLDALTVDGQNATVFEQAESRLTFVYDGQGRRRTKSEYSRDNGQWVLLRQTRYIWDLPAVPAPGTQSQALQAGGWLCLQHRITEDGETATETYLRGLDLSGSLEGAGGIGGMLAVTRCPDPVLQVPCALLVFFDNGRGDITELADPVTGAVVAHYECSPFGKVLVSSGPLAGANPYRFSSKEHDATGLAYYGYRYYSPELGRWINRDPIGERGDVDLYGYCANKPVLLLDASGLEWFVDRQYGSRADVTCACGDTVKDLARRIRLSASEYRAWLRDADGEGLPASENTEIAEIRKFTVPNTGYIDVSSFGWGALGWWLMGYRDGLHDTWNSERLKVVYTGKWKTSVTTITSHLGSSDIYRYAYIGHGDKGGTLIGMHPAAGSTDDWVLPGQYTGFGIAEMQLIACFSNDGSNKWRSNVSHLGWLVTVRGKIKLFSHKWIFEHGTR